MNERMQRTRPRNQVSLPVGLRTRRAPRRRTSRAKGTSGQDPAFTDNIVSKGCWFSIPPELPVGARLEMEVELPDMDSTRRGIKMHCQAKVVRVEGEHDDGSVGVDCEIENYWFTEPQAGQ